ncbi:MAG TPA: hypothetical protein VFG22_06965 [Polyangiales bacterium]|nr:hypothetical protein [Polyangiales bacterium]
MAWSKCPVAVRAAAMLLVSLAGCPGRERSVEPPEPRRDGKSLRAIDPYGNSPSRFGVVPLHAGFSPDPRVVGGRASGQVPAESMRRKCRGWISESPDYLLRADTAFFKLHILARSRGDLVLVVRKPNGEVLCNDNRSGTKDPMIASDIPIGTTQVWVGVHEQGEELDYRLGFSEVKWQSSSISLPKND